jgi:cytochrome c biogenesis protein CcdA
VSVDLLTAYGSALTIGLLAGATHCSLVCAPLLTTLVMGRGEGARDGLLAWLWLGCGRIVGCGLLGALSYVCGRLLGEFGIAPWWRNGAIGLLLLGLAVVMFRSARTVGDGRQKCGKKTRGAASGDLRWPMLLAGGVLATVPCPPLLGVLGLGLTRPSAWQGALLLSLFGLGSSLSPLLVLCAGAGWFGRRLHRAAPHYRPLFRRTAAAVLLLLGIGWLLTGLFFDYAPPE